VQDMLPVVILPLCNTLAPLEVGAPERKQLLYLSKKEFT